MVVGQSDDGSQYFPQKLTSVMIDFVRNASRSGSAAGL